MTESNVIKFPQPADDDLAPEQRMAEIARIAERFANLMETDGGLMPIGELLDRIEGASEGLSEIGAMMLMGADRLKMEELRRNVQVMINRIRMMLARTDVQFLKGDDD